ncbi:DNA-directed RNA polymerases I [Striga asiatica]|uniref:DNA-directed RNA polymerases I n=1 Tax=Striga asiatica TaxID=4170 RepID=A0A5A7RJG5_STRAF|nr:DNA-directed RNA polymerases I [Striga asiatica]
MAEFHFDEIIKVIKFDSQVVYDKVSRVVATSEDSDCYLELDVHTELYPMLKGEKFRMLISSTLNADQKTDGDDEVKVVVYVSFGGLQLMLKGKMHKFKVDQRLFLLLRKI